MNISKLILFSLIALPLLIGCGKGDSDNGEKKSNDEGASSGITEYQMKHGIGPVTEPVTLTDEINQDMVTTGEQVFKTKCTACHKMDQRYVGPPLGDILDKRTPTYIMNMILNPVEMTKKHPEAKKMLAQYMNQMTFQNVTREEARAIVEYLRTQNADNQTE